MFFADLMMFLGIKEKVDERVVIYDQRRAFLHEAIADAEALKLILYLWRTNPEIALEVIGEEQYWEVRRKFETKLGILEKEIEINLEYDKKEVEKIKKAFEMYTTEEFVDDRPLYID